MVLSRISMLALLFSLCEACSGGGFGGINGTDRGSGTKSEEKVDETDDDEEDTSDEPVQVAGAFLTVACAPATISPSFAAPDEESKPYGCALVDKDKRLKAEGEVSLSNIVLDFKDGTQTALVSEQAPKESPWHVLSYLKPSLVTEVAVIRGYGVIDEQSFETVNSDVKLYDPEGLVGTTATVVPAGATDVVPLHMKLYYPGSISDAEVNFAADGAPDSKWQISPTAGIDAVWVIYDAMDVYTIEQIEFRFCSKLVEKGRVSFGESLKTESSAKVEIDGGFDLPSYGPESGTDLKTYKITETADHRTGRYFYFWMKAETGTPTCLNDVRVLGKKVETDPASPASPATGSGPGNGGGDAEGRSPTPGPTPH